VKVGLGLWLVRVGVRVRVRVRVWVWMWVWIGTSFKSRAALNFLISSLCLPVRHACESRDRVMVRVGVRIKV
jgi:hypothetical protein